MISVSGRYWEEQYTNKRLVEKIKIDHNFNERLFYQGTTPMKKYI
jgi:hypothetical protein